MSRTLTLKISENLYERLLNVARQIGRSPEQTVLVWLEDRVKTVQEDSLLKLAGVYESDSIDVSEHHDDYIGKSIMDSHD